jgi:hypothetical protein
MTSSSFSPSSPTSSPPASSFSSLQLSTTTCVTPQNPQSPRDATKHDIQPPNKKILEKFGSISSINSTIAEA